MDMIISENNLASLGFEKEPKGQLIGTAKQKAMKSYPKYSLMSNGYKICLMFKDKVWQLYYNDKPKYTHFVTHVSEIFGFIAEDFHTYGKKEMRVEIRDLLFEAND